MDNKNTLPMIILRGLALFPDQEISFDAGRSKSIAALESVVNGGNDRLIFSSQNDVTIDDPGLNDVYNVGTVGEIEHVIHLPGDIMRVTVKGLRRVEIFDAKQSSPYFTVVYNFIEDVNILDNDRRAAICRSIQKLFENYAKLAGTVRADAILKASTIKEPAKLIDYVASRSIAAVEDIIPILEEWDVENRAIILLEKLQYEYDMQKIEYDIKRKVQKQVDKNQKEYYLHEQIKAIQDELGQDTESEIDAYREKIKKIAMNDEAKTKAERELDRMSKLMAGSPETAVIRNWLDWLLDLPWQDKTEDNMDLKHAQKILDEEHYGLVKVKERIVEYLAVLALSNNLKGPILCFVGPPGVGKTSIARSVAHALGRKFVRMSLGGVRDEAEIRGHRRTYIGAMPGRIISNLKQVGTNNPVFLFDEIDKMSNDFRGDPASAMLEVMDSEQNYDFRDHYLDVPFDLSSIVFLATANTLDRIPPALIDRMEIIRISGYTDDEKLAIARRHLLPKQELAHGIVKGAIKMNDEVLLTVIDKYTREAGVRNLEKELAHICRKVAKRVVDYKVKTVRISLANLEKYLGKQIFHHESAENSSEVGVVTGLAWTAVGGEILKIEVLVMPGSGKFELTGQLGDVMKESASAALSFIRSNAKKYNIDNEFYKDRDIHIHIPEGAIPKDGPSAGITMATSLFSAVTGKKVRCDVAMTGEITLSGKILPIGGLKEKLLAAHRAGIKTVLIPNVNTKDLDEIPLKVRNDIEIIPVKSLDQVLNIAIDGGM